MQSKNMHRLKQNPKERIFLEEWEKENRGDFGVLALILGENNFPICLTEDEEIVAGTVIQWLGSPVGQDFLRKVQKKIEQDSAGFVLNSED